MNNVPFFKKGDTIQGGTLFKGGHYLRKYGTSKNGSYIKVLIRIQKKMTPLWHSWYCLIYGLAQGCNLPEMSETGAKDVNTSTAVLYYSQNNSELTFPTSGFQKCMKKMEIAGHVFTFCK